MYYRLLHSIDKKEVGLTFPQSQTARHTIHTDDPLYLGKQDFGKLPPGVVLPQPVLHPGAKPSDLISNTSMNARLLVSDRLKNIIEPYTSENSCEFLQATVHYLNEELHYWVLNPLKTDMDTVDFSKSEVWLHTLGNTKVMQLYFEDHTEVVNAQKGIILPERIYIERVVFRKAVSQDLIQLRGVSGGIGFFVSSKLKDDIEAQGCTGIQFVAVENK